MAQPTEEQAAQLEQCLGCPCIYLPPQENTSSVMSAYLEAAARGRRESFTPILLVLNEQGNLVFEDLKAFQQEMAATPVGDGKALLRRFVEEDQKEMGEYFTPEQIMEKTAALLGDDTSGGKEITEFLSLTDYRGQVQPVVLAEIPVKEPWEVFSYLPFGGWNECPSPKEQRAAAKYWFEQYGAVPAVMTRSTLEYRLPAPVPWEQAMETALEQYFFCSDIVDQSFGMAGTLAGCLSRSTVWYFWWD
ncbi:MAG: DUF4253 domain-containing protein [Lawsonibacter sp.]|nr:DUF4253 domain-containing protein [Lawsonibacter sp.]